MAQTIQDTALFSDSTGQELKGQAVESEGGWGGGQGLSRGWAKAHPWRQPRRGPMSMRRRLHHRLRRMGIRMALHLAPLWVPLGSTHTQTSLTPVAPHPKRFSAVNINKKFLEKNTTSGSAASSATSSAAKSGAPSGQCHLSIRRLYVLSRLTLT